MQGSLRDDFEEVVHGAAAIDLALGALTIARIGHPDLDAMRWIERLDALAAEIRPAVQHARTPAARARAITSALAEAGFHGNQADYYDPRNSYLNDVIERRLGIPITLSVLAIEVGRRLGVQLVGVAFPGHFLVRADDDGHPLYLDPFHAGTEVDEPLLLRRLGQLAAQSGRPTPEFSHVPAEFLQVATPDAILARILRNLVRVFVERADDEHALAAVDLLLVVTPDALNELRTRGLLYERLGCPAAAAADLHRYLELAPGAPDAPAIEVRAAKLLDTSPTLH